MLMRIKRVYSKMGDNLSGKIYLNRINYSISGEDVYIDRMLNDSIRANCVWKEFREFMGSIKNREVVLFGNGIWGKTLLTELKDFPWKAIIDNAAKRSDDMIPLINAEEFLKDYKNEIIVISSYKNRKAMIEQCTRAGVEEKDIIDVASIIYGLTEGKIYFDEEIPLRLNKGLFVDGGCFDGGDTKRFLKKYDGNAICFEPDTKNLEKIAENLRDYAGNRYRVISKTLWSQNTVISFAADGNCSSHIEADGDTGNTIGTAAIDEMVEEQAVSMIKMDIEGAELEALQGAEKTIVRDHPVLAISIYHKPEDILTIPAYILDICSEYRFYLRHYSFSWYDTVLYAIP